MSGTTSNRLAGQTSFYINSNPYSVVDGSYNAAPIKKEPVVGLDGTIMFVVTPQPVTVSATLMNAGYIDDSQLINLTGASIQFTLASGKTVTATNMEAVESGDTKFKEGQIEVKFVGSSMDVIVTN